MATTIQLSRKYGFAALAATGIGALCFYNQFQLFQKQTNDAISAVISIFAGDDAKVSHQHFSEQLSMVIPATLFSAIKFPILAGVLGWSYFIGRVLFHYNITKVRESRNYGFLVFTGSLVALGVLAAGTAIRMMIGK